jgi:predicted nucleic-acid-binding protein
MNHRLIDTNLIIRYLVQDHPQHSQTAAKLFEACDQGLLTLVILPSVLAECVFVLESFYKHKRADIAKVLSTLISSPGIDISDHATTSMP